MVTGITPFLWFDTQAEEAMEFYLSVFRNGRRLGVTRANGKVLTVRFELEGQEFVGLNGGPQFRFTEAVSFVVNCETQTDVNDLWDALSKGGQKGQCGWLKDRFGVSWQIVPTVLPMLLSDPDPARAGAVMQALRKMDKLVIADLRRAHDRV